MNDDNLPTKKYQIIASAVLVPFLAFTLLGQLPPDWQVRKHWYEPARVLFSYLGLAQYWGMFRPPMRNSNFHTTFLITLQDGTKMIWELPRVDERDAKDRYRVEKWRKFETEHTAYRGFRELWPSFARWIGHKVEMPNDRPAMVSYNTWSAMIPPPSEPMKPRDQFAPHTKFSTVYVYKFSPEDFQ